MSSTPSQPSTGTGIATVAEHVLYEQLGDQVVLLDLKLGEYFTLNGVASRMWSLLLERPSLAEVLGSLGAEYEVPADQLKQDLASFVQELESHGWLRPTA